MRFCTGKGLHRLIFIGLCFLSPIALSSPDFGVQLKQADGLRSADPKKFDQLLRQLEANTASATPDQLEQLRYLQAYRLAYAGQYNLANQKAVAIFDHTKNIELKYRSGLFLSNNYTLTNNFGASFSYLDKTLLLQEKIADRQLRHDGLTVAAVLYNQVGQYQLSTQYAEQILSDDPSPRTRCLANGIIIEASYRLKSLPKDDAVTDKMIASCSDHGEILLANMARVFLARKWVDQGESNKTISLLENHLDEIEATGYPRLISEVHSLLGEYKLKNGNLAEAERHANITVKVTSNFPFSSPLVVAEKTLYEIAMRRNDTAAAFEHYRKYAEADKAYLNDVKARELGYQLVKHETLQKTQTIDLLNKKNEVLQLEKTVAKQKAHYTAMLLGLLVVLLTLLMYWGFRTKRMQLAFRRLAETDTLTGISNRDHFTKNAETALADAARKSEEQGLIMFDLDNFKTINDRFGHSTGDWVLKQVTAACKPICRKQDFIGRIGGEEFAILLHASDLASATRMAERFREHIAAINTAETGHVFSVTASFGVTTTRHSGYLFDSLLSQADQALYQSKRDGRNRVSSYDKLKPAPGVAAEAAAEL